MATGGLMDIRMGFREKDIRQLERVIGRLPVQARRWVYDRTVQAAARTLAREARKHVRVLTGDLKRHIVARKASRNASRWIAYKVGVRHPETPLAHLVEFGTAPHDIPMPTRWGGKRIMKHPGSKAYPFLRPAVDLGSGAAIAAARKAAARGVRKMRAELAKEYRLQAKWVDRALE